MNFWVCALFANLFFMPVCSLGLSGVYGYIPPMGHEVMSRWWKCTVF